MIATKITLIEPVSNASHCVADTPQFREGNPYFFSENPYKSVSFIYASIYRENVHAIHIAMQFAKKSRHCVIQIDTKEPKSELGATVGLGLRL